MSKLYMGNGLVFVVVVIGAKTGVKLKNQNSNLHFTWPSVGMYTQNNQRDVLTSLLGSAELADVYLPGLSFPSVHIQCSTAQYSAFTVHVQYIYKVDRLCQEETCTSLGDISLQMLTL